MARHLNFVKKERLSSRLTGTLFLVSGGCPRTWSLPRILQLEAIKDYITESLEKITFNWFYIWQMSQRVCHIFEYVVKQDPGHNYWQTSWRKLYRMFERLWWDKEGLYGIGSHVSGKQTSLGHADQVGGHPGTLPPLEGAAMGLDVGKIVLVWWAEGVHSGSGRWGQRGEMSQMEHLDNNNLALAKRWHTSFELSLAQKMTVARPAITLTEILGWLYRIQVKTRRLSFMNWRRGELEFRCYLMLNCCRCRFGKKPISRFYASLFIGLTTRYAGFLSPTEELPSSDMFTYAELPVVSRYYVDRVWLRNVDIRQPTLTSFAHLYFFKGNLSQGLGEIIILFFTFITVLIAYSCHFLGQHACFG